MAVRPIIPENIRTMFKAVGERVDKAHVPDRKRFKGKTVREQLAEEQTKRAEERRRARALERAMRDETEIRRQELIAGMTGWQRHQMAKEAGKRRPVPMKIVKKWAKAVRPAA